MAIGASRTAIDVTFIIMYIMTVTDHKKGRYI